VLAGVVAIALLGQTPRSPQPPAASEPVAVAVAAPTPSISPAPSERKRDLSERVNRFTIDDTAPGRGPRLPWVIVIRSSTPRPI
jgi:hypothetical protein